MKTPNARAFRGLTQDISYGLRMLFKRPGFTVVVVLTLALGIGANSALFSIVNSILINPLPYERPHELMTLHQSKPNFDAGSLPYPNFLDWQRLNHTFSSMAVYRPTSFTLSGAADSERVAAQYISADLFTVFGINPTLGRAFVQGEDQRNAAPLAVISFDLWQRRFAGASDVVGKGVTLDGKSYTIIGVLPKNWAAPFVGFRNTEVFVPIGQWQNPGLLNRGVGAAIHGLGRLKTGVTFAQGKADLETIAHNLALQYPETNKGSGASVIPLKELLVGRTRPTLYLLLGAVGFVLLIACANVGNLLLARSASRANEFAIRAALGAGSGRLIRQHLTETTLLALLGGAFGVLVAAFGTDSLLAMLPASLPRAAEIKMDWHVFAFAAFASIFAAALAGIMPALKASRISFVDGLKQGKHSGGLTRHFAQRILVALEMALALVLLVGAGLMIRTLRNLWNIDPGFKGENVCLFGVSLPQNMATENPDAIRASLRELNRKFKEIPGVEAVSFSRGSIPLEGDDDISYWPEGELKPSSGADMGHALIYIVEPSYLAAMQIKLKEGRFFSDRDTDRSAPVLVIDEVFREKNFAGRNAIGARIQVDGEEKPLEIVGVVEHVKQWGLEADDQHGMRAQVYAPFWQLPNESMAQMVSGFDVIARVNPTLFTNEKTLQTALRRAAQSQNAQNTVFEFRTMKHVIATELAGRRLSMVLLEVFGALALLLAAVGLYGVVSYLVGQRTHELGIRVALGAKQQDILGLVLGHGLKTSSIGIVFGIAAGLALTRLMTKLLYGVAATDVITFAVTASVLLAVALLATLIPAIRATRVNPLIALKYE